MRATVWNIPAGTQALSLDGIANEMADAAFSPDGRRIATSGPNNDILVWDAASGFLLQDLSGHAAYVSHVLWISPSRFVTNDWSGIVKSWTKDGSGKFVHSGDWGTGSQSLGIALSPDATTLVAGGGDPTTFAAGFMFLSPLTAPARARWPRLA